MKILVYSPTGAIWAAPTTSLPEALGGDRNWDYRHSWIRDSANSLWAFHILGCGSETGAYLHWLIDNNPRWTATWASYLPPSPSTMRLAKAKPSNNRRFRGLVSRGVQGKRQGTG